MDAASGNGGLREGKKRETRRRIREHAMRLFLTKGFEATTVEEIAAAAGISYMTFFRHFPAKHDVIGDESADRALMRAIGHRPAGETALVAVHHAALEALDAEPAPDGPSDLARLILSTPALRSWLWERHQRRVRDVADALLARDPGLDRSAANVVAAACVAVMGTAVAGWVANPQSDLRGHLDGAFRVLRGSTDYHSR
jgi:AcrR family transcriptional regulator